MQPQIITPGEPAGIGPDLCVMLAQQKQQTDYVIIADRELLEQRAKALSLPLNIEPYHQHQTGKQSEAGTIRLIHQPLQKKIEPGKPSKENAGYLLQSLDRAMEGCMSGEFSAMVTGPLNKEVINQAGIPFTGHTEYLAEKLNTNKVVMMLATEGLKVALVTTHLPLSKIPEAITKEEVEQTLRIVQAEMQTRFGIKQPRISVCGLNPHAGEGGYLGMEEIETIIPVMEKLRTEGYVLEGPLPADTAFTKKAIEKSDVIVAMYHDQGLPVLKHMGFGDAVNVTLGLPIIRTSVDHGTALDLAATGNISVGSLKYALKTAAIMAKGGE